MLASLPMYDFPEVREATDGFWAAVAKACGTDIELSRGGDWSAPWRNPNLLFSQTCGYPFTHAFAGLHSYVATPHYGSDGCKGPDYCSILFARGFAPLRTFQGKRAAFNTRDSMSGMLALQLVFAPMAVKGEFFDQAIETGGHLASLAAVQAGEADICATDCVTVAYMRRYRPEVMKGLEEVGRSPQVPGLPFVTRAGDVARLRAALHLVMNDPSTNKFRQRLMLTGVSALASNAYHIIPDLEKSAQDQGGLRLW